MFQKYGAILGGLFGLFVVCATHALAQHVNAYATVTCNSYSISVSASGFTPGMDSVIYYSLESSPASNGFPITGMIPFTASSTTFNDTVTGSFPPLSGNLDFSGTAMFPGVKDVVTVSIPPVSLTCEAPPPISGDGCIYTLGRSGQGVTITGSANVTAPGCSIFDNSGSSDAATMTGSARLVARSINIVGGYRGMPNSYSPTPTTGVAPISDPLASIPEPAIPDDCAADPKFSGSSAHVLSPGCYNGLSLSGSGDLTLEPGLYIINGSISLSGSRSVSGTGVTFYTTGTTRISGSRVLMLSAPTSGTYNGLLFFQSRSDFRAMSFSGSTGSDVRGIIYAPNAALTYSGSTGATFHTDLVVDSVTITGSATIHSYASSQ